MSGKSRRPPIPTAPPTTSSSASRTRASSLSIARSPSVLSSITLTSPTHFDLDPESHHHNHNHAHAHTNSTASSSTFFPLSAMTHTLERTLSHPPPHRTNGRSKSIPGLSSILSDDALPLPLPASAGTPDALDRVDAPIQKVVMFEEEDQVREYEQDEESNDTEERIYTGAFQPPDSKELLGILLSVGGVAILAVAAGLTTIFDWVL